MQIRFKKFTPAGSVQFQTGELADLPAELAQTFVDAGDAAAVPQAEAAKLRYEPARAYPVPARFAARKGNKSR